MKTTQDQNLSFTIVSELTGEKTRSVGEARVKSQVEVKINSQLTLQNRAFWQGGGFPGQGPLPPEVGKRTFFTISWQLANFANDVDGVTVVTKLPPNIRWEGVISPAAAKVSFVPETSEIKWDVGRVRASAGFLRPAQSVAFRISVIPSASDVAKIIQLTTEAKARGTDTFTQKTLESQTDSRDTGTLSDVGFLFERGVVRP